MAEELGVRVSFIDFEYSDITYKIPQDPSSCLHYVHGVITLTSSLCCNVVSCAVRIYHSHARAQLVPVVSLPGIQLCVVPIKNSQVDIVPDGLRGGVSSIEGLKGT